LAACEGNAIHCKEKENEAAKHLTKEINQKLAGSHA
jgi:hypothetical protein